MCIPFNADCFFPAPVAPLMGSHCLETDFTRIAAAGSKGREKSITLCCFGRVAVLCLYQPTSDHEILLYRIFGCLLCKITILELGPAFMKRDKND